MPSNRDRAEDRTDRPRSDDGDLDDLRARRRDRAAKSRTRTIIIAAIAGVTILVCAGVGTGVVLVVRGVGQGGGVPFVGPAPALDTNEIDKAYRENPVAAAKKYAGNRYRFEAKVSQISSPTTMVLFCRDNMSCIATAKSSTVEAVKNEKYYVFDGKLKSYTPRVVPVAGGQIQYEFYEFEDVSIVEETPIWHEDQERTAPFSKPRPDGTKKK